MRQTPITVYIIITKDFECQSDILPMAFFNKHEAIHYVVVNLLSGKYITKSVYELQKIAEQYIYEINIY